MNNTLILVVVVVVSAILISQCLKNKPILPHHMYGGMNIHGKTRNIMHIHNVMGNPIEYKVLYDELIMYQGVIENGDTKEIGPNMTILNQPTVHTQQVIFKQENCPDYTSETYYITPTLKFGATFIAKPSLHPCQMNVTAN